MNIKKTPFYFGLRILLPIQMQLLKIENPKNDVQYATCGAQMKINLFI
jgi:hypothetical protein